MPGMPARAEDYGFADAAKPALCAGSQGHSKELLSEWD